MHCLFHLCNTKLQSILSTTMAVWINAQEQHELTINKKAGCLQEYFLDLIQRRLPYKAPQVDKIFQVIASKETNELTLKKWSELFSHHSHRYMVSYRTVYEPKYFFHFPNLCLVLQVDGGIEIGHLNSTKSGVTWSGKEQHTHLTSLYTGTQHTRSNTPPMESKRAPSFYTFKSTIYCRFLVHQLQTQAI